MSTASISPRPRAAGLSALGWVGVGTIAVAFTVPFFIQFPLLHTIILGVIGIACAIFGSTGRAKTGLIIGNVLAMMSPPLVFAVTMTFLWIASLVTGGSYPPPDYG